MKLRSISEESGGKLEKGDRIIGLDNDDIRTWTLARGICPFDINLYCLVVVQRLTDIRAPVGVVVTFSFSRRVRIDGASDHEESQDNQESNPPPAEASRDELDEEEVNNFKRESVYSDYASADIDEDDFESPTHHRQQRSSVFSDYTSNDIDEDDFVPPQSQESYQRQQRSSVFSDYASNDIDEDDFVPPPNPEYSKPSFSNQKPFSSNETHSETAAPPVQQTRASKAWDLDPMVEVVTLRAENEDLQSEVSRLNSIIAVLTKERDTASHEANEYRMKYEAAESERIEFLKQLSEVEIECQQLEKREKDALQLLEKVSTPLVS